MSINKEFLVSLRFTLILFFIIPTAWSKFMVEPYFKSIQGTYKRGGEDGVITGQTYGLNTGYMGQYFMAGFSFENGEFKSDDTLTEFGYEKYTGGGIGSYLGFHFFDRLKIWTGYLNSAIQPTSNKDFRLFGQNVSFGLGYRVWQGLIFNAEAFRNQYTQKEDDISGKTLGLDTNIKTEGVNYFVSYFLIF